mgnify:CR=1 FL=1
MKKIIAFGDIHGCYLAANTAVKISEDKKTKAIFLGDYVDRGPSAMQTIKILNAAKKRNFDWIFIRGNHDQMVLDLILGKASPMDTGTTPEGEFEYWQAVKSFHEWQSLEPREKDEAFQFLDETVPYYETKEFIFCHAVLRDTDQKIEEKSLLELIWNYDYDPLWTEKPFVHGHLPVKEVTKDEFGININTSCGYGGFLTGYIIDPTNSKNNSLIQIQENGVIMTK